jgi:hypothetical protein
MKISERVFSSKRNLVPTPSNRFKPVSDQKMTAFGKNTLQARKIATDKKSFIPTRNTMTAQALVNKYNSKPKNNNPFAFKSSKTNVLSQKSTKKGRNNYRFNLDN